MSRTLGVWLASFLALAIVPAAAHDDDKKNSPAGEAKTQEADTGDIFGFSEGADTPEKGAKQVSFDTFSRFHKRRLFGPALPRMAMPGEEAEGEQPEAGGTFAGKPRYRVMSSKLAYQYAHTDDLAIEVGLFGHARDVRNLGDVPNKRFAAFDGGSVAIKYRLIERTGQNPFALSVLVEPRYARVEESTGRGVDAFQTEALLILDARIIPDRLWFATNIGYEPELTRLRGTGQMERASGLTWSNALTTRATENAFVGAEVRYVAAYEGAFLNRFAADAFYIGPLANVRFSDAAFLTAALAFRVTGSEPQLPPGEIGAAQFPRTLLRIKVGASF
jgi:hypothetical protein